MNKNFNNNNNANIWDSMRRHIADAEKNQGEIEKERDALKKKTQVDAQTIEDLKSDVTLTDTWLGSANEEIAKLEAKIRVNLAEKVEWAAARNSIEEKHAADLARIKQKYRNELEEAEAKFNKEKALIVDQRDAFKQEVDELKAENGQLRKDNAELVATRAAIAESEGRNGTLKEDLTANENVLPQKDQMVSSLTTEKTGLDEAMNSSETDNNALDTCKTKLEKTKTDNEKLRREYNTLDVNYRSLVTRYSCAVNMNKTFLEESGRLKSENENLKTALQDIETPIQDQFYRLYEMGDVPSKVALKALMDERNGTVADRDITIGNLTTNLNKAKETKKTLQIAFDGIESQIRTHYNERFESKNIVSSTEALMALRKERVEVLKEVEYGLLRNFGYPHQIKDTHTVQLAIADLKLLRDDNEKKRNGLENELNCARKEIEQQKTDIEEERKKWLNEKQGFIDQLDKFERNGQPKRKRPCL